MLLSEPKIYDFTKNAVYVLRYQDQIKANVRIIQDNKLIKLIEKIELASLLRQDQVHFKYEGSSRQIFLSGKLLGGNCVQKSTQSYCAGCIRFQECESTKNLNLTVFCWNLGRPCQELPSWFSSKIYLEDESRSILISGGASR